MQQVIDRTSCIVLPRSSAWRERAIDLTCALFAALPLMITAHVPLYDVPNHTAMLHVLLNRADSATLQKIYGVHWAFTPNMALQVAAWLLSPVLSIETSVRLFCIAIVMLLCGGTRALALALSGSEPGWRLYRAAPLLCWGAPLQYGFTSYCFGIGLMLMGLAAYIRLRTSPWPTQAALFIPFSVVLLGSHLIAFGIFVTGLAGCELAHAVSREGNFRSRAIWLGSKAATVSSLTLPALLVLWMAPPLGNTAAPGFAHHLLWSTPFLKAQGIAAITWFAMPRLEVPLLLAAISCLAVALWLGMLGLHKLTLGMVCTIGTLWLILPRDVPAGHYVDYRVPWAISFILLAGLIAHPPRRHLLAVYAALSYVLAILVVVRVGSVCWRALRWEPEIAAVDHALSTLPVGTNLWVIRGIAGGSIMKTPPLEHTSAFIVTRRQGFEAEVFAGTAGEMVYLKPPYRGMYRMVAPPRFEEMPAGFDATLVLNPSVVSVPAKPGLHCAAAGPDFLLLTREGAPSACR